MDIRKLTWAIDIGGRQESVKTISDTDKKFDELKGNMTDTTAKAKGTTGAIDDLGNAAKKSSGSGLEDLSKGLDDLGQKLGKKGKQLTTRVTAPLLAAGGASVKMAMDLEDSTKKVGTLVDENIVSMEDMSKGARDLSDDYGIALNDVNEAIYDSLSAGVDTGEVLDFVKSNIDLTRAGFTDMGTAIDATTTVMNAYEDGMYDISEIHDIFVQTQDKGKISVDELGSSIGRVIPNASALNVGMHDLGASYAIMTAKGQNAQLSTTNLNAMIGELGKTGSDTDEILRKKTGKSFEQLMESGKSLGDVLSILDGHADGAGLSLNDLFGSTSAGSAAVTLLSSGVDGYNESLKDMHDSQGKTAENAEKVAGKSLELKTALNKAKNAFIDLGVIMAPVVTDIANGITKAVDAFNNLDDSTKDNIVRVGALVAAIGPALMIGGKLMTGAAGLIDIGIKVGVGLKKLGAGFKLAAGLIGKVVGVLGGPLTAAIAVAVAGGILLYKNWDTVKEKAIDLGGKISEKWTEVKTATVEAWDSISKKITGVLDTISEKWQATKDFFSKPIKGVVDIAQRGIESAKERWSNRGIDGSSAGGKNFIGKDGAIHKLHRREMVLTGDTADEYRSLGGSKDRLPDTQYRGSRQEVKSVSYSPEINVIVQGNADKQTTKDIGREVNKQLDLYFRKLNLQRG